MIRMLKPRPLPKKHLPQCTAMRVAVYWCDTPDTNRQCSRQAIVEIDGALLCMQHAGPVALERLIEIENEDDESWREA